MSYCLLQRRGPAGRGARRERCKQRQQACVPIPPELLPGAVGGDKPTDAY